ncbi:hypothetical protein [Phocicoccus schoeneichii]|uniref:hypothetical protein n=1 Tax=Phocicoccus schoeneichii TaxID=1812261 RepID=UPI003D135204
MKATFKKEFSLIDDAFEIHARQFSREIEDYIETLKKSLNHRKLSVKLNWECGVRGAIK